jgi:methyl-accepting chemotaxis protein
MVTPDSVITFIGRILPGKILKRTLVIALVVGSILNIINQYDAIFSNQPLDWVRFCLNSLVPFLVSSYSAAVFGPSHD